MNHDRHLAETPCPTWDDLSAWRDGFLVDRRVAAHLDRCAQCQQALHDMEAMDLELMQHLAEVTPDEATLQRMVAKTRRRIEAPAWRTQWLLVVAKLAACVALLAAIAVTWRHYATDRQLAAAPAPQLLPVAADDQVDDLSPFEQQLVQRLVREFGPPAAAAPAAAPDLPSSGAAAALVATPAVPAPVASQAPGTLNLPNIRMVGYGAPTPTVTAIADEALPREQSRQVGDRVRHVWLVDDTAAPLRELQVLMPRHRPDFEELINQNQDEYVLQLLVSDQDLQALVDHFARLQYKLMSPEAPQPGQGSQMRLSGKQVRYEVDFVRK
jgi:hypothetical protein